MELNYCFVCQKLTALTPRVALPSYSKLLLILLIGCHGRLHVFDMSVLIETTRGTDLWGAGLTCVVFLGWKLRSQTSTCDPKDFLYPLAVRINEPTRSLCCVFVFLFYFCKSTCKAIPGERDSHLEQNHSIESLLAALLNSPKFVLLRMVLYHQFEPREVVELYSLHPNSKCCFN